MLLKKNIIYKEWLAKWLKMQKDYVKESTYANYSNIVYGHIIPKLGEYKLRKLNNEIIQKFIIDAFNDGRLDAKGGLSIKTVKDIVTIIKSSLKAAIDSKNMDNINLKFNYPTTSYKKHKLRVLNKNEQDKITKYIINNPNTKNIGILISLYSGIRIGELCALKWKDIDFKNNILYINKTLQRIYLKNDKHGRSKVVITSPKTANSNRAVPINKYILSLLANYKGRNEEYVISGTKDYIEPRTYRRFFTKLLDDLGIQNVNFHALRHTFATNCISLGVDYKTLSEILGHANINLTLNLYVHPQLSEKRKCINLLNKNFEKINN